MSNKLNKIQYQISYLQYAFLNDATASTSLMLTNHEKSKLLLKKLYFSTAIAERKDGIEKLWQLIKTAVSTKRATYSIEDEPIEGRVKVTEHFNNGFVNMGYFDK